MVKHKELQIFTNHQTGNYKTGKYPELPDIFLFYGFDSFYSGDFTPRFPVLLYIDFALCSACSDVLSILILNDEAHFKTAAVRITLIDRV